jgi:hypothetical protein
VVHTIDEIGLIQGRDTMKRWTGQVESRIEDFERLLQIMIVGGVARSG